MILPDGENGKANNEDPVQTAPPEGSLIWVCTICPDLSENLGSLQYEFRISFLLNTGFSHHSSILQPVLEVLKSFLRMQMMWNEESH